MALALSGCIAVGNIGQRAITVNQEVGSSQNQFVLLNLVRAAHDLGLPIIIVNQGKTRADTLASRKLEGQCGLILERLEAIIMGGKIGCDS